MLLGGLAPPSECDQVPIVDPPPLLDIHSTYPIPVPAEGYSCSPVAGPEMAHQTNERSPDPSAPDMIAEEPRRFTRGRFSRGTGLRKTTGW